MSSRQLRIFQEKPGDSFMKDLSTTWFNTSLMTKLPTYTCSIAFVDGKTFEVNIDMQNKLKIAINVNLKEYGGQVSLDSDYKILKKPMMLPKMMVDNIVASFYSEITNAINQMKK